MIAFTERFDLELGNRLAALFGENYLREERAAMCSETPGVWKEHCSKWLRLEARLCPKCGGTRR